jgi:predicted DNA-binding transcriptional regulator YafY
VIFSEIVLATVARTGLTHCCHLKGVRYWEVYEDYPSMRQTIKPKRMPDQDANTPERSDADRRLTQADRLATVLQILHLLLGHGKWDASALAAHFECDERTIYRYLNVLELAGVPYTYDRNARCYRVRPSVKFPVLSLSRDELIGHATANVVSRASGIAAAADAEPTTAKITATSPTEVGELLAEAEAVTTALDLKLADHSRHHEAIRTIQWALIEGKQLDGEYVSPYQEDQVSLTFHPYRLCLTGQAWYLIARPLAGDQPKTYRVMRFGSIRVKDTPADVPADFSLDEYFGNAWSVYKGDQSFDVEIEFTTEAADLVTETVWHKTQAVRRHEDGRVTLTFRVDGLDEIVWWVLGWSGRAKVIQPEELRELVVDKLSQAIAMHQETSRQ